MNIYLDQTQQSQKQVCIEPYGSDEGNNILYGFIYDWKKRGFVKIKFTITCSENYEFRYIQNDGQIIRIDKFIDPYKTPQIMINLEQINHLQWQGAYSADLEKVGKWRALWKGAALVDVGGSYTNGKKFGEWKELFKNYWDNAQVYEIGEYTKDFRKGIWKFIYKEKQIGGGEYNEYGLKTGIWIDLSEDFWDCHQISYHGQYKNGLKIGQWKIFQENINENFEWIGGGYYNEQGQKNGIWEELSPNFNQDERVYFNGEYVNGLKIGKWDIKQRDEKGDEEIGGGFYNAQGLKEGLWLDLSPEYQKDSQIFHKGNYEYGKKIGSWKIIYKNQSIGGGWYDNQELKIGLWADPSDNFYDQSQVMYFGEYVKGKKYGRWDISFKDEGLDWAEWIGGGQYDEQGCKNGKWVELMDNCQGENQATCYGEYKNGKKKGIWDINDINFLIGGGTYDEKCLKDGKWIDYSNSVSVDNKLIYQGNYKHGQRVDNWEWNYKIEWNDNIQEIGGGFYNKECQKDGYWIDLKENFEDHNQIIQQGEYKNGLKCGQWDIKFRWFMEQAFNQIGGGQYDQEGYKQGHWVDLSENFSKNIKVLCTGEYKNSKKCGKWEIKYKNQQIGGGSYDQLDQKNGVWIELSDAFNKACKILNIGEYINGKKFGRWQTNYKGWGENTYEQIGGGLYGQEGLKEGMWIVLSENFREDCKVIYKGEYQNGKKKGKWSIKYRGRRKYNYEKLGRGQFDDQGMKNGLWIVLSDNFCDQNQLVYSGQYSIGKKVGKWFEQQIEQKSICKQDLTKQ